MAVVLGAALGNRASRRADRRDGLLRGAALHHLPARPESGRARLVHRADRRLRFRGAGSARGPLSRWQDGRVGARGARWPPRGWPGPPWPSSASAALPPPGRSGPSSTRGSARDPGAGRCRSSRRRLSRLCSGRSFAAASGPAFLCSAAFLASTLAATAAGLFPLLLPSTIAPAFSLTAAQAAPASTGCGSR